MTADEIECRISQISDKGVSLLLYKTARTDAILLDETVGPENWENDFKVVDGVLYGGIGIWLEGNKVWKWDAGTESNTEAEKGRASDAFKRAGFKWGIGRELYTAPRIWIPAENCNINNGKKCYDSFRVVEIGYDDQGNINKLLIANDTKGVDVYSFPKSRKKASPPPQQTQPQQPPPQPAPIACADCGIVIEDYTGSNGKKVSAKRHAESSQKKFGRVLCLNCIKKEQGGSP